MHLTVCSLSMCILQSLCMYPLHFPECQLAFSNLSTTTYLYTKSKHMDPNTRKTLYTQKQWSILKKSSAMENYLACIDSLWSPSQDYQYHSAIYWAKSMQWEHSSLRDICIYSQNGQPWWKSQMSSRKECSHSIDFAQ